jgi:lipopolysaccharide/colanic/teichoic acid biosynthesis glycosyltransferase
MFGVGKASRRLKRPSSHTRLLSRMAVWDAAWGGISPVLAFLLRDGTVYRPGLVAEYCGIALLASLLIFQWFRTGSPIARFYSMRDAVELLKACALVAALSAVGLFLLSRLEEAPRSIPILHFFLLAFGLLAVRFAARLQEFHSDALAPSQTGKVQHVIIICASRLAWFYAKMAEELAPGAFQIVAVLDERPELKHRSLDGYPIIGAPADLDRAVADYALHGVRVDHVVLAGRPEELSANAWDEVVRTCRMRNIAFEVLPDRLMVPVAPQGGRAHAPPLGAIQAIGETAGSAQLDRPFWKIKRILDFAITLSVLVLASPIALVICALVLVDVGIPIIFWQQRVGRSGAPLYLYKFRTLQAPFDPRTKERREAQSPSVIGRFLRSTRLDELPQAWNILTGDMSLVGPRPLLPLDQPKDAVLRLSVRPGLTGWAQICGGKLISPEEKTALDEWYIRHASLRLDAAIILRTVWLLITRDRRNERAISSALVERSSGNAAQVFATTFAPSLLRAPKSRGPSRATAGSDYQRQEGRRSL